METALISDEKLYEFLLKDKQHKEDRRDSINSYYIILFTGMIGIFPFIKDSIQTTHTPDKEYITILSSTIIELIGLMLSIIWSLSVRRIWYYLEILDERIEQLEKTYNTSYITYIRQQSQVKHSPDRVTKYQLFLPYIFTSIFLSAVIYSVLAFLRL